MAQQMPYRDPYYRYRVDPTFNSLVKLLEGILLQAQFTPTELREACIIAAVKHDQLRPIKFAANDQVEFSQYVLDQLLKEKL